MADKPIRPPSEVLDSIRLKSKEVKEATDALSSRIQLLQDFITNLPGRVETYFYTRHPDHNDPEIHLEFWIHRDGKDWVIDWDICSDRHPEEVNQWKRLADAPLRVKLSALHAFPEMLAAIENAQVDFASMIRSSVADFDKMLELVKAKDPKIDGPSPLPRQWSSITMDGLL